MLKRIQNIRVEDFQYHLPEDRIAAFPVEKRDQSKLLVRTGEGKLSGDIFCNLSTYLAQDSHVFFNNSRVIPARLIFKKETGSKIEIFCLQPVEPAGYEESLAFHKSVIWKCMIGNMKKFSSVLDLEINFAEEQIKLHAEKILAEGSTALIKFSWDNNQVTFADILSAAGQTPLPPYIKRPPVHFDKERYQTIYSENNGSVAAPTAGLHFTDEVLGNLKDKNITPHYVTLHVGAGTFQPVKSTYISGHPMHTEFFELNTDLIEQLKLLPGKVTSVGTTTLRTLESIYWLGVKLLALPGETPDHLSLLQWEPYELPDFYTPQQSFEAIDQWFRQKNISSTMASTAMIIVPGYDFKTVNVLITNFHQPGSTLLMLIAAFIGESWKEAYNYALENNYRFLSYGDSSLLLT